MAKKKQKRKKVDALDQYKKALNARKAYVLLLRSLPPVISHGQVDRLAILQRLCLMWDKDPKKVKETDAIDKYVKGGPGVMSAYYAALNESPEFKPDGLSLQTNDTAFATTVRQLINAIANWYVANK